MRLHQLIIGGRHERPDLDPSRIISDTCKQSIKDSIKQAFLDACEKRSNTTMTAESKQHRRLQELADAGELEPSLVSRLRTDLQGLLAGTGPDPLPDQIVWIVSSSSAAILALKAAELKADADRYICDGLRSKRAAAIDVLLTCMCTASAKGQFEIANLLQDAVDAFRRENAPTPLLAPERSELERTITTLKARVKELEAEPRPDTERSGVTPTEETIDPKAIDDGQPPHLGDFVRARVLSTRRWIRGLLTGRQGEHRIEVRSNGDDVGCGVEGVTVLTRCSCDGTLYHDSSCPVYRRVVEESRAGVHADAVVDDDGASLMMPHGETRIEGYGSVAEAIDGGGLQAMVGRRCTVTSVIPAIKPDPNDPTRLPASYITVHAVAKSGPDEMPDALVLRRTVKGVNKAPQFSDAHYIRVRQRQEPVRAVGQLDVDRLSREYLTTIMTALVIPIPTRTVTDGDLRDLVIARYSTVELHNRCAFYLQERGWGGNSDRSVWMKNGERLMLHQAMQHEATLQRAIAAQTTHDKDAFSMSPPEFEEHKRRHGIHH